VIQRGRNILIVVGVLCFAVIATQAPLLLHVLSCEHPEEHDCSLCPICRHLLICPEKYTAEPNTQLHITSDYVCPIDFHPLVFAGFFHPLSFNPRPPPSVG